MDIYSSKQYKISRIAFMVHSAFNYFVSLVVVDVFLSNLLKHKKSHNKLVCDFLIISFKSLATRRFYIKNMLNIFEF